MIFNMRQPDSGYRFSMDPFILSDFANPGPEERILDLGTGCGIIPVLLSFLSQKTSFFAIEIQRELSDLARANIIGHSLDKRVTILHGDMKLLRPSNINGMVDLVVTNPPYTKRGSGRLNPADQKAVARHEIAITLKELIKTGRTMLRESGRFIIIYPARRLTDLLTAMRQENLEPRRIRAVHPYSDAPAKLIMVEGIKDGNCDMTFTPPLVLYERKGQHTRELNRIYERFGQLEHHADFQVTLQTFHLYPCSAKPNSPCFPLSFGFRNKI